MASLDQLPDVALAHVMTCFGILGSKDITSMGNVCRRFYDFSKSDMIWKRLLHAKWPFFYKLLCEELSKSTATSSAHELDEENNNESPSNKSCLKSNAIIWKKVCCEIEQIVAAIDNLSSKMYNQHEVDDDDLMVFDELKGKHNFLFQFMRSAMLQSDFVFDLTAKYYCQKALRFLNCQAVILQITETSLLDSTYVYPDHDMTALIVGSCLIDSWLTTRDSYDVINEVYQLVIALKNDVQSLSGDQVENMDVMLKNLNCVFFDKYGFFGNQEDYYNVNNSLISQVVYRRTGVPILLSMLYYEIASRLGFQVAPINYPNHFLLRWQKGTLPTETITSTDYDSCFTYIDVFNKGNLISYTELGRKKCLLQVAETHEVLSRMCRNIVAHTERQFFQYQKYAIPAFNLLIVLNPQDHWIRLQRMQLFYSQDHNHAVIAEDLKLLPQQLRPFAPDFLSSENLKTRKEKKIQRQSAPPVVKRRQGTTENSEVGYAVGMVMHHVRYDYTCVIRGWDRRCEMSEDWCQRMGVYRLPHTIEQAFYHVLVHKDGSERYAAQESLEVCQDKGSVVDHSEVGKYFSRFGDPVTNLPFYYPNQQTLERYPDDVELCRKLISDII